MRLQFSDIDRPKAAAKQLVRVCPNLKLSAAQEALARATGYRDWHELDASLRDGEPSDLPALLLIALIQSLASELGVSFGDVQYALTKARLVENLLTLEMQFGLRARAFRQYTLGTPGRGKPGTIVKSKARSLSGDVAPGSMGYLLPKTDQSRTTSQVLFRNGICMLADFEVQTPRMALPDFVPVRLWLPYGYWTLNDKSVVLYNREYLPLWHIDPVGIITRVEPWYWIKGIRDNFNFAEHSGTPGIWSKGRASEAAFEFLRKYRVLGVPRLVEALPFFFQPGVESDKGAAQLLQAKYGQQGDMPSYAREPDN